jgi:DNA-binding CsgD family transcriptional regulator
VRTDAANLGGASGARHVVAADRASRTVGVRSGAELVALSERFYDRIFVGALSFVALSTLTALAFLPLRSSAKAGRPPSSTVAAALIVLLLAGLAIWRAHDVYRLLRRRPQLEIVPVLIAAALLSVASPLRNELWWSACAILMALALLMSLRRALASCLIVLIANVTAHLVAGDLPHTSTVGIVGLWIGLPFWTAMAAIVPDRMASHILRLNVARDPPRPPPQRVTAWTTTAPTKPPAPADEVSTASGDVPRSAGDDDREEATSPAPVASADQISRLTSRQLQVVALLADGYRYRDIAACLSISAGQVHRHVTNAVARLGVRSVNELVAVGVAEGLVPSENDAELADVHSPSTGR